MKTAIQLRLKSYAFLLINTLTWGLALIIVKPSLEVTTPFRYLFYRYVIAAFFSLPILFHYWKSIKNKIVIIKKVILVETFGTAIALGLLYLGLAKTSAIEASFLTTTTPIFVVIAGIFYLKEKEEIHEWLGLIIAFLGTSLLTFLPIILNGMTPKGLSLEGNLLIIIQNIATAIAMVLAKKYYKGIPKLFITSLSFYLGVLVFFLLSFFELFPGILSTEVSGNLNVVKATLITLIDSIQFDLSNQSVLIASFYMALFGSIIGLTAYIRGQEGIEASEASLFWYLQPLVFVPAGILLLNETVHPLQVVAMCLILFGVYVAEKRSKTKLKQTDKIKKIKK